MAGFIADASASLPWCFEDEATTWSEALLDRVTGGEPLIVPAHWMPEIANAMYIAERKGRLEFGRAEAFLVRIDLFELRVQTALTSAEDKAALVLGRKHRLTIYDAIYLELAIRMGLELATLDGELIAAAIREDVKLL
jgi:predicted nucleic acid-binding protein